MVREKKMSPLVSSFLVLGLLLCLACLKPSVVSAAPNDVIITGETTGETTGEPVVLTITGDGVTNPATFTQAQLEGLPQYQHTYSVINTWPTKKLEVAKGIKLRDLLAQAGIKDDAQLLKFTSKDGYYLTLTVKELLKDKRYYFPHFKENITADGDGNIRGSSEGAEEVEPIVALVRVEGSNKSCLYERRRRPGAGLWAAGSYRADK